MVHPWESPSASGQDRKPLERKKNTLYLISLTRHLVHLVYLVCLVYLVLWLNETMQMNQINQINKTNQTNPIDQTNQVVESRKGLQQRRIQRTQRMSNVIAVRWLLRRTSSFTVFSLRSCWKSVSIVPGSRMSTPLTCWRTSPYFKPIFS